MPDMDQLVPATVLLKDLGAQATALVGSMYTLGAGKDIDLLALVDDATTVTVEMARLGWVRESEEYGGATEFRSLRKGDVNVLICTNHEFFEAWRTAAEVCKALRLDSRDDRIKVHQIVRDGMTADEV